MAKYQKVFLRVVGMVGDTTVDADKLPDRLTAEGQVLLKPNTSDDYAENTYGPDGIAELELPNQINATIKNGWLTYNDDPFVWLRVSEEGWNWNISFSNLRLAGVAKKLKSWNFELTAATEDQITRGHLDPADPSYYPGVNLAPLIEFINASTGNKVSKGDQGWGIMSIALVGDDGFQFVTNNPDPIDKFLPVVKIPAFTNLRDSVLNAASVATLAAELADSSKTNAATSATEASASAASALTYRNEAEGFKNTATTQAGVATTKAQEAAASAVAAGQAVLGQIPNGSLEAVKFSDAAKAEVSQDIFGYQFWHDLLAFGTHIPFATQERKVAGVWTGETLESTLFDTSEYGAKVLLTNAQWTAGQEVRFTWSSANLVYSMIKYFYIVPSYSTARNAEFVVESSDDGIAWTEVSRKQSANTTTPIIVPVPSWGDDSWCRLTIRVLSGTGDARFSSIQALTSRKGSQGSAWERSLPYSWDINRKMIFQAMQLKLGGAAINKILKIDAEGNVFFDYVTGASIAANSIDTGKIVDGTIVSGDMADNAIVTSKIANLAVTLGKMAANSVDSSKIVDAAILDADINFAANIQGSKLLDNSLPNAKLANLTITDAKIAAAASIAISKLETGWVKAFRNGVATNTPIWIGTEAEYAALASKDANTLYYRS